MKFYYLDVIDSMFNKTIRKRTWYTEKHGLKIKKKCRSFKDILSKFTIELDDETKGLYRNHTIQLTDYQKSWQSYLMQNDYCCLLTIKLPHYPQSGFVRTKNRKKAIEYYRFLIKELECTFLGKTKHWERNPFLFKAVLEKGARGYWHCHLAIQSSDNDWLLIERLSQAVETMIAKYEFFNTVMDLRSVYDKEGVCAYMVKELKYDEEQMFEEGAEIFDLKTWFKVPKLTNNKFYYFDIKLLPYIIRFALYLKKQGELIFCNPICRMTKKLFHKRHNRRHFKIKPSCDFHTFKFWE